MANPMPKQPRYAIPVNILLVLFLLSTLYLVDIRGIINKSIQTHVIALW